MIPRETLRKISEFPSFVNRSVVAREKRSTPEACPCNPSSGGGKDVEARLRMRMV